MYLTRDSSSDLASTQPLRQRPTDAIVIVRVSFGGRVPGPVSSECVFVLFRMEMLFCEV